MKAWRLGAVWLVIALVGIALAWHWHSARIERAAKAARDVVVVSGADTPRANVEYYRDVKPILDRRCVVCHSCTDAPCQLNLDSPEGVARGASALKIFDSVRVQAIAPSRLFVDAQSSDTQNTAAWRAQGFFSVLNEGVAAPEKNLNDSVLYQMLMLKQRHPQTEGEVAGAIDLAAERKQFCPTVETFPEYEKKHPLQGMPFALPGLDEEKFATLKRWLEGGAKVNPSAPLSTDAQQRIDSWERFLNRDDFKTQLMSRYLYEHLFAADLYLDSSEPRELFKLVRSRMEPGRSLDLIATRRPFDAPAAERVYYRLQPQRATVVAKNHLPYLFDSNRQRRFEQLFLQADFRVDNLPTYAPESSANPFATFVAIPVQTRYRFLLDDAQFFLAGVFKGPGCQPQIGLNVIDDRFWVLFANPENNAVVDAQFLAAEADDLQLPAALANKEPVNKPLGTAQWQKYADAQAKYVGARDKFIANKFGVAPALTLDSIWNGGGTNDSAALTVFRHFDTASVVRGLVGELPKTAWLIDYAMLERMHYGFVAGIDIYGAAAPQLATRLQMDFLRMEGETNFLNLLPKDKREQERKRWYQGANIATGDPVFRKSTASQRETGIVYHTKNPKREFFEQLQARLGAVLTSHYDIKARPLLPPAAQKALANIAQLRGRVVSYLPEVILMRVVVRGDADQLFTLLHDVDYANVSLLAATASPRRPQFDSITVVPGIIGAYPHAFWVVNETDLPKLVRKLAAVEGPRSYRALTEGFAVARTDPRFWQESDWILNAYRNLEPIEWGLLDYSRYQR